MQNWCGFLILFFAVFSTKISLHFERMFIPWHFWKQSGMFFVRNYLRTYAPIGDDDPIANNEHTQNKNEETTNSLVFLTIKLWFLIFFLTRIFEIVYNIAISIAITIIVKYEMKLKYHQFLFKNGFLLFN